MSLTKTRRARLEKSSRGVELQRLNAVSRPGPHQYCGMCWLRVVEQKFVPFTFRLLTDHKITTMHPVSGNRSITL